MRLLTSIFIVCVLAIAVVALATHLSQPRAIHAQTGCDLTSLSGAYGYGLTGYAYDNQGNLYIIASAGRLVADGNGGVSGADTYSFDGTIGKRSYTGTYTMNTDCTGSVALQISVGNTTGAAHGDIVSVNNGNEINFVQTDTNYILSGVFKKQTP